MQITSHNFYNLLPSIKQLIRWCDYISIDLEFTGIISDNHFSNQFTDSEHFRFCKQIQSIKDYFPIQVGITAVGINDNGIECVPLNMYIKPFHSEPKDTVIEASTLNFLLENGMDFDKVLYEGVHYAPLQQSVQIPNSILESRYTKNVMFPMLMGLQKRNMPLTNINTNYLSKGMMKDLSPLIDSCKCSDINSIKSDEQFIEYADSKKVLKQKHPTSENYMRFGASLIFKAISESNKPLVLHNGVIDSMMIYNNFIIGKLDSNILSYRETINSMFSLIYDTKLMANLNLEYCNKSTSLGDLYMYAKSKLNYDIHIPSVCKYTLQDQFHHEAGFDSLLTAIIYSYFLDKYGILQPMNKQNETKLRMFNNYFLNKLPNSSIKVPFDIKNSELSQPNKNIYVIKGIRSKLSLRDLETELRDILGLQIKYYNNYMTEDVIISINDEYAIQELKKLLNNGEHTITIKGNKHSVLTLAAHEENILNNMQTN